MLTRTVRKMPMRRVLSDRHKITQEKIPVPRSINVTDVSGLNHSFLCFVCRILCYLLANLLHVCYLVPRCQISQLVYRLSRQVKQHLDIRQSTYCIYIGWEITKSQFGPSTCKLTVQPKRLVKALVEYRCSRTFDEGLGPKRQSHLYSVVLEFFLCYSITLKLDFYVSKNRLNSTTVLQRQELCTKC